MDFCCSGSIHYSSSLSVLGSIAHNITERSECVPPSSWPRPVPPTERASVISFFIHEVPNLINPSHSEMTSSGALQKRRSIGFIGFMCVEMLKNINLHCDPCTKDLV